MPLSPQCWDATPHKAKTVSETRAHVLIHVQRCLHMHSPLDAEYDINPSEEHRNAAEHPLLGKRTWCQRQYKRYGQYDHGPLQVIAGVIEVLCFLQARQREDSRCRARNNS